MRTLLLAEHRDGRLDPQTAAALTAVLALGAPVDVLVAGAGVADVAQAAARLVGVVCVRVADAAALAHQTGAPLAALLLSLAAGYDAFAAPASSTGKDILPRLAAQLGVMQVSDVVEVLAPDVFRRPSHAGNVLETVRTRDAIRVFTVRSSAFAAAAGGGAAPVEAVAMPADPGFGRLVRQHGKAAERPDLGAAKIVVSGGRGLGSRENFDRLILPLAHRLGAAVGASRAAVDAGYAASELQVGQTGRIVAPELYIAIGISGAIQHLAGMRGSKTIVAINTDPHAPIFGLADFGLVGDLFELVPALTQALAPGRSTPP